MCVSWSLGKLQVVAGATGGACQGLYQAGHRKTHLVMGMWGRECVCRGHAITWLRVSGSTVLCRGGDLGLGLGLPDFLLDEDFSSPCLPGKPCVRACVCV